MNINRLAAIDIGSNSVKLLISDAINSNNKIALRTASFTRVPLQLGEDTFSMGYVSEEKIRKLSELIKTFISLVQINEVEYWSICATSALREAANANEIVDYLWNSTRQYINIISTDEEARLIGLNLENRRDDDNKVYVVADVGGGCTEITAFVKNQKPVYKSFDLGTIRPLKKEEELSEWKKLETWMQSVRNGHKELILMGSGGNINQLNSIFRKRGKIKRYDLNKYYIYLKEMDYEEFIFSAKIGLNRAMVIMPAIKIYLHLMKILKAEEIEIPVIGLADGMIRNLYSEKISKIQF
ncbi:Ppx/GppA phosphatase family protein [Dysgonomonas macrotermitis]|uniref:Exopolyphosphatase / guanosine-5'-triphosphate,3'-diphosphate pyrophosphatase n=1 Tax=Dysgonomonas macrotermitis TaxID=1346286 RepID=A0A1M4W9I0_9BACT|nr:hypothetical protein [Dysgonomonas macrotermitis]SHE77825.1 exopolyphosphatase / guanosine-5'-triphosphate,3'-diphosphate pyrophosphatase [Dysgonomonas macrotermitis]